MVRGCVRIVEDAQKRSGSRQNRDRRKAESINAKPSAATVEFHWCPQKSDFLASPRRGWPSLPDRSPRELRQSIFCVAVSPREKGDVRGMIGHFHSGKNLRLPCASATLQADGIQDERGLSAEIRQKRLDIVGLRTERSVNTARWKRCTDFVRL